VTTKHKLLLCVLILLGMFVLYTGYVGPYLLSGTTPPVRDYYISRNYLAWVGDKMDKYNEEHGSNVLNIIKVAKIKHEQMKSQLESRSSYKRAYGAFNQRQYKYLNISAVKVLPSEIPLIWDEKQFRGKKAVLFYDHKVRDVEAKRLDAMISKFAGTGGVVRDITLELR
jgi:hypothetical protein